MTAIHPNKPFSFRTGPDQRLLTRSLIRATGPAVERALGLSALNQVYRDIIALAHTNQSFSDRGLEVLGIQWEAAHEQIERIPKTGPVIVVANHPFGGIEGLILCSLIQRVRPDYKVLANYMLSTIPELRDVFFFVDPFGNQQAVQRNIKSMRQCMQFVKDGHLLGVFPAGEVSHLRLRQRAVADPTWSSTVGRIAQKTGASVVPLFIDGRNSTVFQLMGLIHPRLRTAMLPRELLKKRGGQVSLHIGNPIPGKRLARFDDAVEATDYLRIRTYLLRPSNDELPQGSAQSDDLEPIIEAVDPTLLEQDIAGLPEDALLHQQDDLQVFSSSGDQLPNVLREIGRLREVAFRMVDEGSGNAIDLDRFDQSYQHLFIWHARELRIVGAYRLGLTDKILPVIGRNGLYTSTLFRLKRKLLDQINPAIELGRSFVNPLDQKSYSPLFLLWKGISLFAVKHPRYRYLFGPVSISASYSSMSKRLLVRFLELNQSFPQLGKLIRPRNAPRLGQPSHIDAAQFSTVVQDLKEVNELISELEADGKAMPVLLRQYLKLNGQLLGFNIDPEFGDVLDGLMLFDMVQTDRPTLYRYMGKENAMSFLKHHGVNE